MTRSTQFSLNKTMPASFRDPAGQLFTIDGRIVRIVNRPGVRDLKAFLNSSTSRKFIELGSLVRTDILDARTAWSLFEKSAIQDLVNDADGSMIVEHERVPFQNFPYEWPPEMLYSAGSLTLDLAESLLDEGLGLKDATPYNIVFRGANPVFVDLLSFEQRNPGDPIWLPQAQFERTFLLPLLVNKYFGIQLDQLLSVRRDGLEAEDVYRMCGPLRKLMPPFLSLISIPAWLGARHNEDNQTIYKSKILDNLDKARFILRSSFRRLRRILNNLEPERGKSSAWSDYTSTNNNYSESHLQAKNKFVDDAMIEFNPKTVLDIGCNTGDYSAIAARRGARVVAIDTDAVVIGETWRRADDEGLDILPLVVNLTRPSPATGWRNCECPAFLDRTRNAFDAVLMLAVIHHMLVSERIPLPEIIDLAAEMTSDILVIEFIAPEDSMFRRLLRGRDQLFSELTPQLFEESCRRRFEIVRSQHLERTSRWLYVLRKKK
jgi:2-polyprenyl-3-methyl-5-hydroxy-6-metoxy-1,4-benzoquinol methylase